MTDHETIPLTDPASPYDAASAAARWMLVFNGLLCTVKLLFGWLGGSFPLLADGVNNLTDVGISLALFAGLRLAQRPADSEHAYGHGKIEQEIARLMAVGVLITGGLIVVESIRRLPDHHTAPHPAVLVVAFVAIVVKSWMYRYQTRKADDLDSHALRADAMNHKWDVAATTCVLIGAGAVWLGGPTWSHVDDLAALAVGIIMIVIAAQSVYTISSELLDRMPPDHVVNHVRCLASAFPRVQGVDRVVGRRSGLGFFLDLHLEVKADMSVRDAHELGHQVKGWLMAELPEITDIVVHLEPSHSSD
ncbi:MAG: cation transporter [Gemmatimonadetes bacterium]|jgi:cation diffusion facilitator family transporter|nr:cation transporter [Gemmatimonadota bacterium]MBT7864615.1 cation transporter [Gemmatimonadota bacterium]